MARTGWSSANFLRYGGAPVAAVPLSVAMWVNVTNPTVNQVYFGLWNSASTGDVNCFEIGNAAGQFVFAGQGAPAANGFAGSTGTIPANTWTHVAGVFTSLSSRSAYRSGGNKGTDTTVLAAPTGINRTTVCHRDNVSNDNPMASGSLAAEIGLWNIALSDADVLALSKGLSPLMVHPEALVAYWPLIGRNSPENNLKSNAAVMSITGSLSQAAHPRIIMPARRRLVA